MSTYTEVQTEELISVIQKLSLARDMETIMDIFRKSARKLTAADGATFILKEGDLCHYIDEDAIGPLWKGQRFPLTACISGWAILNKKAATIEDIYIDSRIPVAAYEPTFVKSLVMVPIRKENPIGAIGNYWSKKIQPTEAQVSILQTLADSVAMAIENVQLYSQLENKIQQLDSSNKAKEEFLMIISHELRTPLNSILGWAQLLSLHKLDENTVREGLDSIKRNAGIQARMIEDLLDTTRIMLGKLDLKILPIHNLTEVILEAVNLVRLDIEAKSQDFKISMPSVLPSIYGDVLRIQQIIINLLSNAVKFTPNGGKIHITVAQKGPGISIEVEDTGKGMDVRDLPNIFNRFFQVKGDAYSHHDGLGLGLAIVKYLIEAHNGQIQVESAGENKGSKFSILIPILEKH